jgi:hypothetical protein
MKKWKKESKKETVTTLTHSKAENIGCFIPHGKLDMKQFRGDVYSVRLVFLLSLSISNSTRNEIEYFDGCDIFVDQHRITE